MPPAESPRLEYNVHLNSAGKLRIRLITAPTLNFVPGRGLRCAVSIDDQPPQIVELRDGHSNQGWSQAVKDGVWTKTIQLAIETPGLHVLKFWYVDPAVVLQRLEIDAGGLKPTYLGPPESPRGRRMPTLIKSPH